jgi:hypothetical protein
MSDKHRIADCLDSANQALDFGTLRQPGTDVADQEGSEIVTDQGVIEFREFQRIK